MPASLSVEVDTIEKKNNNDNNNNIGPTFVCSFYFQDQATVYSGIETENNGNKNKRKRKVWFLS